jgi:hypothetical protein
MSLLPTDLPSFTWGAVVGVAAAFGTGFLKKAGEQAYSWLAHKINPPPVQPIQVDGRFVATAFEPSHCAWVGEPLVYDYETKGYTHYPHPKNGARCLRTIWDGNKSVTEVLLVQPGAVRRPSA